MSISVECTACGEKFFISSSCCGAVESGDLTVQYFACPACGWKHQIITTDPQMRALIEQRKSLKRKIAIARSRKFREKTIQSYLDQDTKIKTEQERLAPILKTLGEEILHRKPGEE